MLGFFDGFNVAVANGCLLGVFDGFAVGFIDGFAVGFFDGLAVGTTLGAGVGVLDGFVVGDTVGLFAGDLVGEVLGIDVLSLGAAVCVLGAEVTDDGAAVFAVGLNEGADVGVETGFLLGELDGFAVAPVHEAKLEPKSHSALAAVPCTTPLDSITIPLALVILKSTEIAAEVNGSPPILNEQSLFSA